MREILITEVARSTILDVARTAHPSEAGGILVGVYSGERPWVTHALQIPSWDSGPSHYVVPGGITRRLVACIQEEDWRLGYLGEWHVHPADAGPSRTDVRTMRSVARGRKHRRPVLVIARRGTSGHRLDARELVVGRLRELDIVVSGDISPPPRNPTKAHARGTRH